MNENLYLKHIESIPSLLEEVFSALDKEAARIAKKVSEFPLKCVYLYGSGDSWSAALGCNRCIYAALQSSLFRSYIHAGVKICTGLLYAWNLILYW